jgi:hypothetical protein
MTVLAGVSLVSLTWLLPTHDSSWERPASSVSPKPSLLVRTSEQVRYRLEIGDRFMQEIVECGKVMYEPTHG